MNFPVDYTCDVATINRYYETRGNLWGEEALVQFDTVQVNIWLLALDEGNPRSRFKILLISLTSFKFYLILVMNLFHLSFKFIPNTFRESI